MDEPKNLPQTLIEAIRYFSDQDVCVQFVAKLRWPDGPICPTCGGTEHSYLTTRRVWKCKACKRQFSVKVGSIFEDSAIPLDKWLAAMWMIANSKNGVSSHKMARSLGITQKSAWFLLHRIRLAMQTGTFAKLDGEIEVDETFIGGKARNMHKSKRAKKITGTGGNDKAIVAGVLQRGGEVRAVVVSDTRRATLQAGVRQHVEKGAVVYSDALQSYNGLAGEYDHKVVDHAEKYVDGQVHVNGVENFWSLLKRGLHGTNVPVQPWHPFRYMDERVFTYNERDLTDPRPLPGGAGHGCRAQTDLQGVDRQGTRWTA
jgi:transposase-like protein